MHVKKGDSVIVISGKSKGHTGKILRALPKKDMVVVEGANIVKKHQRASHGKEKGQIIEIPMPVHVSNVKKAKEVKKVSKKTGQKNRKSPLEFSEQT